MAFSTQNFVRIDAIRDGVLILKGGGMRGVLRVSSINFALKSQEEQDAIIFAFQSFLNSLDFDIQIFINSRFLNIDEYIATLADLESRQNNDLLRIQTQEYRKFIKEFVETTNIVSTDFFVVAPLNPFEQGAITSGGGKGLLGMFGIGGGGEELKEQQFAHYRTQLEQRLDFVAAGLHRMGLLTKQLETEELIVLFWNLYNPQGLKKRAMMKPLEESYTAPE
ncbi:MAG: hypothetical protein HYV65_01775 [Candidatus Spechtbacteria bacterium]|nr:hypothetical protein [Candidatus Spechtbacteria bacterium]